MRKQLTGHNLCVALLLLSGCASTPPVVAEPGEPDTRIARAMASRAPAATIGRFHVRRVGTSDNGVVTFGSIFQAGDLPDGRSIAAFVGGREVPVQLDAKAFHADGSVRHGIVSADLSGRIGRREAVLELQTTDVPAGRAAPGYLPEQFDAEVIITERGRRYRAGVKQFLGSRVVTEWIDGPLVAERRISGPLVTDDGAEHPNLAVTFGVRAVAGRDAVRVEIIVENTWTFSVQPRNVVYDLEIRLGDEIRTSEADLKHFRQARWRKLFWWGDEPEFVLSQNSRDLIESGVVPNYDPAVRFDEHDQRALSRRWRDGKARNGMATRATMGPGLLRPSMPGGGDRADIGPLPAWTVQYLLTLDPRAREAMLGTADQAGSFPSHYRDRKTGHPVSIEDYPDTSLGTPRAGPQPLPACEGDCDVPYKPDTAHLPSIAFVPYLVTGDHYYLEEMLFWGTYINLYRAPRYRHRSLGIVKTHQVRGQAWALRTLAHIDWILPSQHPQKAYWSRILHNNIDYYTARYVGLDGKPSLASNALGIVTEGVTWDNDRRYVSWMDDYFTWAMLYLVELGYEQARPMLEFKVTNVIERMTSDDFCYIFAAVKFLYFRDSRSAPVYDNFAKVYEESIEPEYRLLPCGGVEMARALGLKKGELLPWRRKPPQGFPHYMQIALAAAVDSGNPKAAAAWWRWENRVNPRDPSRSPEWSVLPRSTTAGEKR